MSDDKRREAEELEELFHKRAIEICGGNERECKVCTPKWLENEKLFDIPDGTLAPDISTKYGGIGFRVFPGDHDGNSFLEVDGMWADGHTAFGCIIPIKHCPWCGRPLGFAKHGLGEQAAERD